MTATESRLRELMARRILILDGAMGTMIQQYRLSEADFRGEQFILRRRQERPHRARRLTPPAGSAAVGEARAVSGR